MAASEIGLDPDVGRTPQREAPTLAQLYNEITFRLPWLADQPLEVDAETWKLAREEMVDIQKHRGFPLAVADIKVENFLLRGVPVVVKDKA